MTDSIKVKSLILGLKPYVLVELNQGKTVDLDASGASKKEYLQMLRTAIRAVKKFR